MELGSERALDKAKANIRKFYPVVGVLEDFQMTLDVAEKIIPRYFEGISYLYNEGLQRKKEKK